MSEFDDAVKLARRVLDKPYIDPDGDICMLARQFERLVEINAQQVRDWKQEIAAAIRQAPPAEPNLADMRPNASGFCDP